MLGHGGGGPDGKYLDVYELSAVHTLTAQKAPSAHVAAGGAELGAHVRALPALRAERARVPRALARGRLEEATAARLLVVLGVVVALITCYMFTGIPTGFAATLIVSGLILSRAGLWWRREPARTMVAANA